MAASAVRTLARTETFMPMNPAVAGKDRADQKSDREQPGNEEAKGGEDGDADNGDRRILAFQIGLRALGDRPGDLLHARRTGIGGKQFRRCDHAVDDRIKGRRK